MSLQDEADHLFDSMEYADNGQHHGLLEVAAAVYQVGAALVEELQVLTAVLAAARGEAPDGE